MTRPHHLREVEATDPDPEVTEKPKGRRVFTAAYKRAILEQVESCKQPGEIGALLRREGLYSSHLGKWRQQLKAGELGQKRGPKPQPESPKRIQQLEREVARLQSKLQKAELIIDVQKKLSQLLNPSLQNEKS
jgi:transposase-like protein